MTKVFLSTTAYIGIAFLGRLASALAMFFCVRNVSPDVFGEFSYMQASVAALVGLASFGIESSVNTVASSAKRLGQPIGPGMYAAGAVCATSTLVVVAVLIAVFVFGPNVNRAALGIVGCAAVLQICLALLNGALVSLDRPPTAAAISCFPAIGFLAFSLSFTSAQTSQYMYSGLVIAQAVACSVGVTIVVGLLRRQNVLVALGGDQFTRIYRKLLVFGIKSSLVGGGVLLGHWILQTKMIGEFGSEENAVYGLSTQIYNVIIFAPYIAGPLLVKFLASLSSRRALKAAIMWHVWFAFGAVVMVSIVWTNFSVAANWFLPPIYSKALEPVIWAAVGAGLHFAKAPFSIYFQTRLTVLPDAFGAAVGAILVLIGSLYVDIADAATVSIIRALCHGVQLLVVACFFMVAVRYSGQNRDSKAEAFVNG